MASPKNSIVIATLIVSSVVFITLYLLVHYPRFVDLFLPKINVRPIGTPRPSEVLPEVRAFADAQQPVLKRQFSGSTEYEIIGRLVNVPTLDKRGEYTGQIAVAVGATDVLLPITLGRDTFTIFLGEHDGTAPNSASTYSMKTMAEALPFFTLKQGKPAVIRLKTKTDARIDPQSAQCGEYCQYVWKWFRESGSDAENILDALIRGEQQPASSKTTLFVTQIGFLTNE